MLTNSQIQEILTESKLLPPDEFKDIQEDAKSNNISIDRYVVENKIIDPSAFYEAISNHFKVPYINLKDQTVRKDILFTIPEPIAYTHFMVAFDKTDKELKIATIDADNLEIFEFLRKKTGLTISVHIASHEDIKNILKQYHKSLKAKFDDLTSSQKNITTDPGVKSDLQQLAQDIPIVRLVDTLLEYAIYREASDIHIEPEEKDVIVRYRIDGVLHDIMTLPKPSQPGIIARIKILSNLKVDEHRLPQDGRFKISSKEYNVSFRVSIIPTFDGEKIVMRLLNEKMQILNLEQLGFQPGSLEIMKRNVKKPHGMILVTGPTGSGKTTTLYTVLGNLNTPEVNISTVEDPVEYRMERVNQTQVNSKIGLTFAIGLRSLLRQDPDIIMVGEIRDEETANIAIHSAMTGHMVLSTLHTNDAVTTIPRMGEMGVPAFLLSNTLNVIVAQRLVRKICTNCLQSYNLDPENIKDLGNDIDLDKMLARLEKEKIISNASSGFASLLFYRGKGCNKCGNTGYKGRTGLYETLEITPEISEMILKKAGPEEIRKKAKENGMLSMIEDGFIKAINSMTTIEEIMRVTKE